MVKKGLFVFLASSFTEAMTGYCTLSPECADGEVCNMSYGYGGHCESCPGNTNEECDAAGYEVALGTVECKNVCVVEKINCYVNNGGCSHGCNDSGENHVCECPTCWTLGDDKQSCSPDADKLTTTCNAISMVIRMNKCVMGEHDWTTAKMTTGCAFAEDPYDADFIVLINSLEECGMELSFTDDSIVYTNNMLIEASRYEDLIVVRPDIEWQFECAYQTEYTISGEQTMSISTLNHGFAAADAKFAFAFDFYEDSNFGEVQADPTYQVGQQVNYGITMNEGVKLTNLHFVATECIVTNGDDSYTVFDNADTTAGACEPSQPLSFTRYDSDNDAQAFFSFMGFQFKRTEGDSSPNGQTITCTVRVCHEEDTSSACNEGCYA